MTKRVGVDIGANAVRVVAIDEVDADGFASISRVGIAALKPGAFSGGRVRNPQQVATALVKALKEAGVQRYGFVLGLSAPEVAVGRYALPAAIHAHERSQALMTMGIQLAPLLEADKTTLASSLVRVDTDADGNLTAVLTVAGALSDDVRSLQAVCKLAGASPRAIDLAGAASMRSLVRTEHNASEIATVVDVGASKTTIATRQGAYLRSLRTVQMGGDDVTRALVGITGEDSASAERRKASLRLPALGESLESVADENRSSYLDDEDTQNDAVSIENITEALLRTTEQLVDAIAQVIESEGATSGAFTQGISLCGGGALLRGFKERLAQRTGVPVLVGRPWAKVDPNRRTLDLLDPQGNADPRLLLSLSTAIGLALWEDNQ